MNRINKFSVLDLLSSNLSSSSEDEKPIRKLFVNNLRGKIDKVVLRQMFSKFGRVIDCRGPFFSAKGYPFCFVTFFRVNDAAKALEAGLEKSVLYNGKSLRIVPAFPRTQPSENEVKKLVSKKRKKSSKSSKNISKENKASQQLGVDYINSLDDYCLMNIFTYLSINERMRIERVCKRWETVSANSWNDIKALDLSHQLLNATKKARKIKNRAVEKIVERCGRFLTSLNFYMFNLGCTIEVLPVIGQHCQNITRLSLQLSKYPYKDLSELFSKMRKIEFIELKEIGKEFKSEVLGSLPFYTIREVHLSTTLSYGSFEPYLRNLGGSASRVFRKLKNIQALTLNGFILKTENVKSISERPELTYLSLANCSIKKNITTLTALKNLVRLNLSKVLEVTDEFLTVVSAECRELKYLNISECLSVSTPGIQILGTLPNLEILLVNGDYHVKDLALSILVKLHELHCESCNQVSNYGILVLIETAPNLRYLNVYNTSVTPTLLDAANALTRRRTNNLILHIKVGKTVVDEWKRFPLSVPSPLLFVESKEDIISDISDESLYDDEDVGDEFWDIGFDDFDDYVDYEEDFDYNGGNPFFIF